MSLRSFLLACTIVSVLLGAILTSMREQRVAVKVLEDLGATVYYDDHRPTSYSRMDPPLFRKAVLEHEDAVSPWKFPFLPRVRHISIYDDRDSDFRLTLDPAGWKALGKLESIQYLSLDGIGDLTTDSGDCFEHLRQLEVLRLIGIEGLDDWLPHIHGLTNLQALNLCDSAVGDRGMKALSDLKKLRYLDCVKGMDPDAGCTDLGVMYLSSLSKLQCVRLSSRYITGAGIQVLAKLPALTILELYDPDLDSKALVAFRGNRKLRSLFLSPMRTIRVRDDDGQEGYYFESSGIDDEGFASIGKLMELEELSLNCQVTPRGLAFLRNLPKLNYLALCAVQDTALTDREIEVLSGLTELRTLTLQGVRLTDQSFSHIAKLSNLERLELRGDLEKISDAGLAQIATLPKLTHSDLYGWYMPNTTRKALSKLVNQLTIRANASRPQSTF